MFNGRGAVFCVATYSALLTQLVSVVAIAQQGPPQSIPPGPGQMPPYVPSRESILSIPPFVPPRAPISYGQSGEALGQLLYPQRFNEAQSGGHRSAANREPAPLRAGCAGEAEEILARVIGETPLLASSMRAEWRGNLLNTAALILVPLGLALPNFISPDSRAGFISVVGTLTLAAMSLLGGAHARLSAVTHFPELRAFFSQLAEHAHPEHAAIYRQAAQSPTIQNISQAIRTLRDRIAEQRRALGEMTSQANAPQTRTLLQRIAQVFSRRAQTAEPVRTRVDLSGEPQVQTRVNLGAGEQEQGAAENCTTEERREAARRLNQAASNPAALRRNVDEMVRALSRLEDGLNQTLTALDFAQLESAQHTNLNGAVCEQPAISAFGAESIGRAATPALNAAALAGSERGQAPQMCSDLDLQTYFRFTYNTDAPNLLPRSMLEAHSGHGAQVERAYQWLRNFQNGSQQIATGVMGAGLLSLGVYELVSTARPLVTGGAVGARVVSAVSPRVAARLGVRWSALLRGGEVVVSGVGARTLAGVTTLAGLMPFVSVSEAEAQTRLEFGRINTAPTVSRTLLVPVLSETSRQSTGQACMTSLADYNRVLGNLGR